MEIIFWILVTIWLLNIGIWAFKVVEKDIDGILKQSLLVCGNAFLISVANIFI